MSVILRPYQTQVSNDISHAWTSGARVVCAVLPTGAGKTVVFTQKIAEEQGVTFSMAHRQELVGQISMAHAFAGIEHSVQAPKNVVKWIIQRQVRVFGRHFYQPQAHRIVCSVQTLLSRSASLSNAINRTRLWVGDEFHHFLRENQWGRVVALFPPGCRGLGVTATPGRADGKGLGAHADGLADCMVIGPNMRQLINAGYLSDYRIFGPYSDIDLSNVAVSSATGDYSKPKLTAAVRQSHIVGDVVQSYQTIAPGKIGVTFVTDVKTGEELAQAYVAAGVPARLVHAKTPDRERQESTDMLARGDLKQLVNVDIFGEGYDLPAIETISMARPTESYPLYAQQFGRSLRILEGKTHAIIIDHVKNVERHGLPDTGRTFSLDSRDRRSSKRDPDLIPVRTCMNCTAVYESWVKKCPYCSYIHINGVNRSIEHVEGDLIEIDPETLRKLRGEIDRIDAPDYAVGERLKHAGAPPPAVMGAMARHRDRQEAQAILRECIALWAGYQRAAGGSDSVIHKRFYRSFGVDMLTAQTLGRGDAEVLSRRVHGSIF